LVTDAGGSDPTGLVVVLGAGYHFWIADEWSVGPLARFSYAPLSRDDIEVPVTAFGLVADFK
jgi:outer membrane autotransporter protein